MSDYRLKRDTVDEVLALRTEIERLRSICKDHDARYDKKVNELEDEIERLHTHVIHRDKEIARLDALAVAQRVDIKRLRAIESAARLLVADVRERHPEQELYCPFMQALD